MGLFPCNLKDKKETLAARASACTHRVDRALRKLFDSVDWVVTPAQTAQREPTSTTPRYSSSFEKRFSTPLSRVDLELALGTPLYKIKNPKLPLEGYKDMTAVSGSEHPRQ